MAELKLWFSVRGMNREFLKLLRDTDSKNRKIGIALLRATVLSPIESDRNMVSQKILDELIRISREDPDDEVKTSALSLLSKIQH